MDPADLERATLHRTWFTWPAWFYYAYYLLRCDEELFEDIHAGRYVP